MLHKVDVQCNPLSYRTERVSWVASAYAASPEVSLRVLRVLRFDVDVEER